MTETRHRVVSPPKIPMVMKCLGFTLQVLLCGAILVGLSGAYPKGALSNFALLYAMVAIVIVFLSRLWAALTGNLVWRFWTKDISGRLSFLLRYWGPVLIRLIFYGFILATLVMGIIPKQFPTAMAEGISLTNYILVFGLVILSLLPKYKENWIYVLFCAVGSLGLGSVIVMSLQDPKIEDSIVIGPAFEIGSVGFHAGSTPLINYHTEYSDQVNALDIIIYNPEKGTLAKGMPLTEDPCFGAVLLSPVNGRIAHSLESRPDNEIGQTDRDMPVGNHISIDIEGKGEAFVLMAHLKQDSLTVEEGDMVRRGQPVAQCGNSGNTSGPHLHIQVQDKAEFDSKGLSTWPIYFDGIIRIRSGKEESGRPLYIRRNDVIQKNEMNKI